MKNNLTIIIFTIIIFIVSKLIWWTFLVSFFLAFSFPIIFILWSSSWNKRIISIITWLFLMWIDFFLLIIIIVPTWSYSISWKEYYKEKENYMKIFFKDSPEQVNNISILLKKNDKRNKLDIKKYEWKKIKLRQDNKISFTWKKTHKSYIVVYLWDGSILRLTPWTKISLEKITKNMENMSENQTKIKLEQWSIWFRAIRMIKDSKDMNIETWNWQTIIIRWTAWLVSKEKEKIYTIWYSHFIEVKNKNKSEIIKEWEWVMMNKDWIIKIINIEQILDKIWITKEIIENFKILDKKYLEKIKEKIINNLKEQVWSIKSNKILDILKWIKLKIYSIWNEKYKKHSNNFQAYQYLIWKTDKLTRKIIENENLVFIAWNLQMQKAKTAYLYNELKKNIKDLDLYKTYIINLWIEWKINNVNNYIKENINKYKKNPEQWFKKIDNKIDNFLNNLF